MAVKTFVGFRLVNVIVNPSLHYMLPDAQIRGCYRISKYSLLLPLLNW